MGFVRGAIMALAMVTGFELSPADGLTENSWSGQAMSVLFDRDSGETAPDGEATAEDAPVD